MYILFYKLSKKLLRCIGRLRRKVRNKYKFIIGSIFYIAYLAKVFISIVQKMRFKDFVALFI